MNRVWLSGNIASDVETRQANTPGGAKPVAQFRLATNEGFGVSRESEYHTVVCWEELATEAAKHAHKGVEVFVVGRIKTRSWDDRNTGEKRYRTEVIAKSVEYATRQEEEPPDPTLEPGFKF